MLVTGILLALLPALALSQQSPYNTFDGFMRLWRPTECIRGGREYQEQETWDVGLVRYQCIDRKRVPVECNMNRQWYRKDQSALSPSGQYETTCQLDRDGYMRVFVTRCVDQDSGRRYGPGETWTDQRNKFWFRCERLDEMRVHIVIGGCVTDLGTRLDIGEVYEYGETWYKCEKKPSQAVAFCTQGCIDDRQRYNVGQIWTSRDGRRYRCDKDANQCKKTLISEETVDPTYVSGGTDNWNTGDNWIIGGSRNRCEFYENGRLVFYLPENTYTIARSEEWNQDVYVLCKYDDYERRYTATKEYYDPNSPDIPPALAGLTQGYPEYS